MRRRSRDGEVLKQLRVNRDTNLVHDSCLSGARIRYVRSLSQDFAKFFSGGRQVSVLRAGDAHRDDFIGPGQWAKEQSFSAHVFENRGRERDASTSFDFRDERTGAVAFHRDARLDTERIEDALKADVILGVILPAKTDQWFSSDLFQSDGFETGKSMRRSECDANRIVPQRFEFQTFRLQGLQRRASRRVPAYRPEVRQ